MNRAELRLTDVAVSDILEQADWYEQRSDPALARRWENKVTAALIRIEKNPRSGAKCGFRAEELQGVRRMPIAGFPRHLIFYRAKAEEIKILRVVHGARDLDTLL
ncbi:MAG: type II toxin-antitoxin system RelE/ParE family toxin [Candidatus Sulfotelmatobacter sp.]